MALHQWAPRRGISAWTPVLFYVALAVGLLLAWNYNRSRAVAILLLFGLTAWALPALVSADGETALRPQLLCVLVPVNVAILALCRDQPVLARTSLMALGILGLQATCIAALPLFGKTQWGTILTTSVFQPLWPRVLWIGWLGLLTFAGMLAALVAIFYRRQTPLVRGMFWGLAAAFMGFVVGADSTIANLYFGAGMLVVGISVLEHAHAIAYRDELTGLPSRRALNEFLPRVGGTFAVAMVDVDHFKKFNDTYGHDIGDEVLIMVARRLGDVGAGRIYRYGGEEFIAVFPDLSKEQALPFLESLRVTIQNSGFRVRGRDRRIFQTAVRPAFRARKADRRARKSKGSRPAVEGVTVSIGLAERTAERSAPAEVIAAADKALYKAKQNGRNRVEVA